MALVLSILLASLAALLVAAIGRHWHEEFWRWEYKKLTMWRI